MDSFGTIFLEVRHEKYMWLSKDAVAASRLAKYLADNASPEEAVRVRTRVYLEMPFTKENHVGFAAFVQKFQSCAPKPLFDPDRLRDV